jgi:ATP-binding cassette subfamily F protein uup
MANRLLISLEEAHLSFGGKSLFEGINLYINEGDKICLVGKNGSGKTTLMKMATGDLELDGGTRFLYPNTTFGYLAQKVDYNPKSTIREFVLDGLARDDNYEEKQHLADVVIGPLEIEPDWLMSRLSGGQLRRAALAKALVSAPDILLLDEPTNHLDLEAIKWLETYLAGYKGALICVSHDRAFLNAISRKVVWIDRGKIRVSPGGYAEFDEWADKILEQEAREIQNLQKKIDAEVDWTQGGVTARRKRNIRRVKQLHALREKIRADKAAYKKITAEIHMDALAPQISAKRVAEFKNVNKSFTSEDGKKVHILKDFNYNVMRGDRIGVLGRNGSGKSTFLKMLVNQLEPDSGLIRRAKNIDISYFDQYRTDLDPDKSLWRTICPNGDYVFLGPEGKKKSKHVCGYLKDFLFDPKAAQDKVSTLSGGQQNRLMLARIMANPGNVLILDEPTNDLDMDTLDMLQEVLADYPGTLVIVSHDRDFLDRSVTEVLAFEGDAVVSNYMGGYTDYLRQKEQELEAKRPKKIIEAPKIEKPVVKAISNKVKYELEKLPQQISDLEVEIIELSNLLEDPELYTKDPENFDKVSHRYGKAKAELERLETRWLEISELAEQSAAS